MKPDFTRYIEIPLDKLIKADWNYKEDDAAKAGKLINNIKRNNQLENILVRKLDTGYYEIVNGNHRYDAFKALEFETVVVYNLGQISLAHAQRIAIETNETRFSSDPDKLAELIREIGLEFPIEELQETMPFTEEEFSNMIDLNLEPVSLDEMEDLEDEFEPVIPDEPKTKAGDIYELGPHRMYCGDSTKIDDVKKLMNGETAHMLFTDPPYNIDYTAFNSQIREGGKDWGQAAGSNWTDKMSDEDYIKFLKSFISNAKKVLIEHAHYYIWHATNYFIELISALRACEIPYDKVPIQWVKQVAAISWVRYKRITEPCVFAGKGAINGAGNGARWFGPNNETNAWIINRENSSTYIHPTQKPVALAARGIQNSSQKKEIVLDLFLGSGSTLIAADQMERICYGMEMEPKFCDVIVQRYFKYCKDNDKNCIVKLNGEQIDESHFE